MPAVQINAEPGTEIHAEIVRLLKDRRKVTARKMAQEEWSARCRDLMERHGRSLWR